MITNYKFIKRREYFLCEKRLYSTIPFLPCRPEMRVQDISTTHHNKKHHSKNQCKKQQQEHSVKNKCNAFLKKNQFYLFAGF